MVLSSYGGEVPFWQKQKPHRRFGCGVLEIWRQQSEPDRRAAQQQQRVQQQSVVQFAIHTSYIGCLAVLVNW
jgi:hypothetical protein